MSWSVQAIGKAPKVLTEIAAQFSAAGKCSEPEETVRKKAESVVCEAIAAQDPSTVIRVSASGSQSTVSGAVSNYLTISIEPQYGFVE